MEQARQEHDGPDVAKHPGPCAATPNRSSTEPKPRTPNRKPDGTGKPLNRTITGPFGVTALNPSRPPCLTVWNLHGEASGRPTPNYARLVHPGATTSMHMLAV